jgi:hypothetical protein
MGVHYLSDIAVPKMAGTALGNALPHDAAFLKAMKPAKAAGPCWCKKLAAQRKILC